MIGVSVIVPTFNRPELLERALASIAAQTYGDYQIIVVNDGGRAVLDVVCQFEKTIYLSHARNKGLASARNLGIKYAAGKWIAYLDDDDEFYPSHLWQAVEALTNGPARWVYTDAEYAHPDGHREPAMSNPYSRELMRLMNITPVCCVVHEAGMVYEAGLFDEDLTAHEDWDLWQRFANIAAPRHVPMVTCAVHLDNPRMSEDRRRMVETYQRVRERYA